MYWMILPLKRYADFSGRSRRKEYWMFFLGYTLVLIAIGLVAALLGAFAADPATIEGMPVITSTRNVIVRRRGFVGSAYSTR